MVLKYVDFIPYINFPLGVPCRFGTFVSRMYSQFMCNCLYIQIFPKVSRPDPLRCYSMSLFKAYKNHVLKVRIKLFILQIFDLNDQFQSFGLLDTQPPPIPSVTLSLRKRTSHVSRLVSVGIDQPEFSKRKMQEEFWRIKMLWKIFLKAEM